MIGLPDLSWFPKPFGAGDTDGIGAKKLLGQPDVDLPNLLVRETAQNSWDARLEGQVPTFEMRLRRLDDTVRDVLTWNVFREAAPNLSLLQALTTPHLFGLEVADRGTKGLGGPTRNDIEAPAGTQSDYAAFVLTVGAPPEDQHGAGTYGFGKTASYLASACSTILIWSRSHNESGGIDERFIASAMGPRFTLDGQLYTGRQWWGMPPEAAATGGVFRVEPATGDQARQLGEALFERRFAPDETGTSLLVIQPKGTDDTDALIRNWSKAITTNLWPKLGGDQDPHRRMDIRLYSGGVEVPLVTPLSSAIVDARARCLAAVRSTQAGHPVEDPLIQVEMIECRRPIKTLGHLAMTRVIGSDRDPLAALNRATAGSDEALDGAQDTLERLVDSVTLMRNVPELVVKDEPMGRSADGLTRWVGVFKPVADLDASFAGAEPPAHDSWNPHGLSDPRARRFVNVALREIRSKANEFRNPTRFTFDSKGSASTGSLSAALAGLTGSVAGSRATESESRKPRARSSPSARQPKVKVLEITPLPMSQKDRDADCQITRIALTVENAAAPVTIAPSGLGIAIDGGALESYDVRLVGWTFEDASRATGPEVAVPPGQRVYADISYPSGLAIEFGFVVSEV